MYSNILFAIVIFFDYCVHTNFAPSIVDIRKIYRRPLLERKLLLYNFFTEQVIYPIEQCLFIGGRHRLIKD